MTDERYTLDEARAELARRACAADGHAYDVIAVRTLAGAGHPVGVRCRRCHSHWSIAQPQEQGEVSH